MTTQCEENCVIFSRKQSVVKDQREGYCRHLFAKFGEEKTEENSLKTFLTDTRVFSNYAVLGKCSTKLAPKFNFLEKLGQSSKNSKNSWINTSKESYTDMEIHLGFRAFRVSPIFKLKYLKSG